MISYKIFILFLMLLMHYIEDFHLQGCLANLKQKKWWEKEIAENLFHSKDDNPQHRERNLCETTEELMAKYAKEKEQ